MNIFRPFLLFLLVVTTSLSAQDRVWPGDVNNNGVVNEADLLFLGLGFGDSGPARKTPTSIWEQQASPLPWATSAVPGLNSFLADCNGDGKIDSNDVEVIKANFGRTHNDVVFMPDEIPVAIAGIDPAFSVPEDTNLDISPNTPSITIPINLGNNTLSVESLLGISFTIKVNGQAFDASATKFELNGNGWLPSDNSVLVRSEDLTSDVGTNPEEYIVAYTKTNQLPSSGNGLIGEITLTPGFILEGDFPNFRITIDSIILIDNERNKTPVLGTEIILNPVGFRDSTTVDTVICEGQSVVFNDTTLTTAGTYRDTLTNSVGGDSIIILNVAVLPTSELTINDTICQGDTYLFAGDTLSTVGTYIELLPATNGCDSVTILHLEMRDTSQTILERTICQGDSFEFNARALTVAGTYRDTLIAANGCNQYIVLNLTVDDTLQTVIDRNICQGESFEFNEQTLTATGTYRDTLVAANGCNQYVVLNLTVDDTSQTVIDRMICQGDLFAFNGQNLGATGTYRDTLEGVNGCNQYVILNLTVEDRFQTMLTETICQGEAYLFADVARVTSGVYEQNLQATNGCDSVVTLNLTVNDTIETIINQTICENSVYDFNGQALTDAGVYRDTQATINGCDSTIVLNLKVSDRYETERNEMICTGDSITFNNQTIGTTGVYQESFVAANGCDSIITLNLTVNSVGFTAMSEEICFGSIRPFNGQDLTTAGTYLDTLNTVNGCDSIIELTLTVAPILESASEQTICAGDTIEFYTFILTETNSYTSVLKTTEGCDSMVILNLQVLDPIETRIDTTLCPQDSFLFGTQMLTEAGTYTQGLTSISGCDSTVTLNLKMGIAGEGGCMSVGIEEEFLQSIEIYPNPVRQSLFINAPTVQLNHIRLINLTGQVLFEQAFNKGNLPTQQEVNMQDFVPGIYWVLIQTEYGLRQEKVVKF